ncbi:MAG TPA: RNA methyltransferase [bacterium]|nr:RNA methyltransferase [bacterium]
MSLSRQQIRDLRRLQQKKYREEERAFLIEGVRLCEEALAAGAPVECAFFFPDGMENPRARSLLQALSGREIPLQPVDATTLAALTETRSPQGIAALVRAGETGPFSPAGNREPLVLAVDDLADPGNLGTLLRTAVWFGVKSLLLSRDTVELHNPKVVRSSMGALFRLRIHEGIDLEQTAAAARSAGWRLLAAEAAGGQPAHRITGGGRDLLIIGSEAHGLKSGLDQLIDLRITIPGSGGVESLNAAIAAGILLYQLTGSH